MAEQSKPDVSNAKRKRYGKVEKVALVNPFGSFRPVLNNTQTGKICTLMKSLLHRERAKTKLPWKKLLKLPKDERKERIKELDKNNIISEEVQKQRKSIKFGLNSVARAIQHCQISSCLLAGDVEPEILVQHLITLAVTHGIPILVVPDLKKITVETVGFPCTALGIMAKEENHYLKPLDEEISCIFSDFETPSNYACVLMRKIKPPVIRKKLTASKEISDDLQPSSSKAEISSSTSSDKTSHDQLQVAPIDFISLTTESKSSDTRDLEPRIDPDSVYLMPNFKIVPKNPDKMRKRRRKNK